MISYVLFLLMLLFLDLTSLPSMVLMMIFISVIIFFYLWLMSGCCWFSMIFSLLFVGGILVVFMVVSSLFPNTKNLFVTPKKKIFLFFLFFLYFFSSPSSFSISPIFLKNLILSGGNFYSMTLLIVCYFFCFMYLISKDKISLRSFF